MQTASLADDLATQGWNTGMAVESDDILQVVAKIRVYGEAIDVFGSMLEIDFPSAVEFFRPFDKNAAEVLQMIGDIADRAVADAKSRAEVSMHLAKTIRLSLMAASVVGSLLLFGIAALLTRAIVRSVNQIATATEKVAQGHAAVDIAVLARDDELGTIVQSLAIFQSNVRQLAFLAHHDPLTGLPNRALFQDRVQQALKLLDRSVGFAVLCSTSTDLSSSTIRLAIRWATSCLRGSPNVCGPAYVTATRWHVWAATNSPYPAEFERAVRARYPRVTDHRDSQVELRNRRSPDPHRHEYWNGAGAGRWRHLG